ncbi:MAG: HNH endonuclease [Steroidobacteraceae bacterium]
MPDHLYPPLRMCMYCGTTTLPSGVKRFTDEHIIPLALGGNLVLPEASCTECAKIINKQIETPVLFKEWGYLRIKRGFPSRKRKNKRDAQKTQVTLTRQDGRPMRIGVADYSCPVPLYKFKEARIFSGAPRGDDNFHWTMDILTSHDDEMAMQTKFPEWNRQHAIMAQPYQFARLLAKIGFSYAVAEYGLAGFTPLVTDPILGRSDGYFDTVGGSLDVQDAIAGGDHLTTIKILVRDGNRALLIVDIRLFSQIRTPSYHVVVGEIDFDNPAHASVFEKHRIESKVHLLPLLAVTA